LTRRPTRDGDAIPDEVEQIEGRSALADPNRRATSIAVHGSVLSAVALLFGR
jgi:hypothetical protein